ncbi:MAG: hypothetical protein AAGJ38_10185 [Planctomycetota bacterium]
MAGRILCRTGPLDEPLLDPVVERASVQEVREVVRERLQADVAQAVSPGEGYGINRDLAADSIASDRGEGEVG